MMQYFDKWHGILKYVLLAGNMAAFDMGNPKSIVSPGGVGFDINCGVRLLRTNLHEKDVQPIKVIFTLLCL